MATVVASTKHADVYRLFLRLTPGERRSVALRILRNERVLSDLYDHFLTLAQGRSRSLRQPSSERARH
jgi:hypothetical protein